MNTHLQRSARLACKLVMPIALLACGGGGAAGSAPTVAAAGGATASKPFAGVLVSDVQLSSTASQAQLGVPLTFGQVFQPGDVGANERLIGVLADGSTVDLQTDVKATHPDGSIRHAVISAALPRLDAQQKLTLSLGKIKAPAASAATTPAELLRNGFDASFSARIGDKLYTASARDLLASGNYQTWLSGPIVNEWQVSAPLKAADGSVHPHLAARFNVRAYTGQQRARVDVTIENNWAFEPAPQNFTYDATIAVGGATVFSKEKLTHYLHARWRKVVWWGAAPELSIAHNRGYLIASRAVPNYDTATFVSELNLMGLSSRYHNADIGPMGNGLATRYMPTTGGRTDIGLLPGWTVVYLLSMDPRAKEAALGSADLAGSWPAHYRDKNTGRPVSLVDYPYMTIVGHPNDAINPATKKSESFPACGGDCTTPYTVDNAHQPGFAYLPYLVTGDQFYLDELHFWTMYNLFVSNPGYRENVKGLLYADQVRAQAWSLRSLAEAAYITPDADPLKKQFTTFLGNNLDWYANTYPKNSGANQLGMVLTGTGLGYNGGLGMAPWQDDFFTAALGHAAELGFSQALPMLNYKIKFPILRMSGPGACWIDAASYTLNVRATPTGPLFTTIGEAYAASHAADFNLLACGGPEMANALKLRVGEMTGYSSSATGYPSNMQPALAYAADHGGEAGKTAWKLFMGRSVKPNYADEPQFSVVPR